MATSVMFENLSVCQRLSSLKTEENLKVVSELPLDRILIETGKQCTPHLLSNTNLLAVVKFGQQQ